MLAKIPEGYGLVQRQPIEHALPANPELLLAGKYGHQLHVWDLRRRRHRQVIDLGAEQQMVLELRPAHNPTRAYGFAGVVISLADLSASVWVWYLDTNGDAAGGKNGRGTWKARVLAIRRA